MKRILVVDDEPAIRFLLEELLVSEGYVVTTASDGDEADRLAKTEWFDLFLIDLIMPRKDGIETILALRTYRPNAPIIAMSGGWNDGTRSCLTLAGKLGACDTLAKPFEVSTLLAAVRTLLEKSAGKSKRRHAPIKDTSDEASMESACVEGARSGVRRNSIPPMPLPDRHLLAS